MTVRLTRIYTKTGDAGQTHLGDMSRVEKTDPRLVAYADVDEANSVLGEALAKLNSFILPGGTPAAAFLHQARVVVRRAERSVWALLAADGERTNAETARYLNRLSDLLFILARAANPDGDVLWEPGAHSGAHAQRAGRGGGGGGRAAQLHPPPAVPGHAQGPAWGALGAEPHGHRAQAGEQEPP